MSIDFIKSLYYEFLSYFIPKKVKYKVEGECLKCGKCCKEIRAYGMKSEKDLKIMQFFLPHYRRFFISKIDDKGDVRPGWGYIMEFFIRSTFRRKGLGKELAVSCEQFFKNNGVKNIWLTADDITGVPFWKALGYHDTGEISKENNQMIFIKSLI